MKEQGKVSGRVSERGPVNRPWAPKARQKTEVMEMFRPLFILAIVIGVLALVRFSEAAGQGASWQVGRAVIQKAAGPPVLKLSLRNDGQPSKENVMILGRWAQGAPGKRGFSAGELGGFSELGSFSKEVELKKTAILEIPLAPLGTPPAGSTVLEIAVLTEREITDGQALPY